MNALSMTLIPSPVHYRSDLPSNADRRKKGDRMVMPERWQEVEEMTPDHFRIADQAGGPVFSQTGEKVKK
jgi:hypothetical protein